MHRAAVLQVSHHRHRDVIQMTQFVEDGEPGSNERGKRTCQEEPAKDARPLHLPHSALILTIHTPLLRGFLTYLAASLAAPVSG